MYCGRQIKENIAMANISSYFNSVSSLVLTMLKLFGSWTLPDRLYLEWRFRLEMGIPLNLDDPKSYSDKLQWLKLYNRRPEYTRMVDKYEVKQYVSDLIGEEYVIPTLGVWDSPEDIDFDSLPDRFVLKTTHGGGGTGVVICKDKSVFDRRSAIRKLKASLRKDTYTLYKEWPYKDVKKRVIAEQYIEDENGELNDYKFSCFDGTADCVMLCLDRFSGDTKFYFFDNEWNLMRLNKRGKAAPEGFTLPKPEKMDEMFKMASRLSEGLPFARVDLYNVKGRIYFGEITFYPASGFDRNLLPEAEKYFGDKIKL